MHAWLVRFFLKYLNELHQGVSKILIPKAPYRTWRHRNLPQGYLYLSLTLSPPTHCAYMLTRTVITPAGTTAQEIFFYTPTFFRNFTINVWNVFWIILQRMIELYYDEFNIFPSPIHHSPVHPLIIFRVTCFICTPPSNFLTPVCPHPSTVYTFTQITASEPSHTKRRYLHRISAHPPQRHGLLIPEGLSRWYSS